MWRQIGFDRCSCASWNLYLNFINRGSTVSEIPNTIVRALLELLSKAIGGKLSFRASSRVRPPLKNRTLYGSVSQP